VSVVVGRSWHRVEKVVETIADTFEPLVVDLRILGRNERLGAEGDRTTTFFSTHEEQVAAELHDGDLTIEPEGLNPKAYVVAIDLRVIVLII